MKKHKLHPPHSGMYNNGVACIHDRGSGDYVRSDKNVAVCEALFKSTELAYQQACWAVFAWERDQAAIMVHGKHRLRWLICSCILSRLLLAHLNFQVEVTSMVYLDKAEALRLQTTNRNKHLLRMLCTAIFSVWRSSNWHCSEWLVVLVLVTVVHWYLKAKVGR